MGKYYDFKTSQVADECISAIHDWFEENGKDCQAVIGISGGKDSTVVAGLCAKALGNHRVVGVSMPNTTQSDIDDVNLVAETINIPLIEANIGTAFDASVIEVEKALKQWEKIKIKYYAGKFSTSLEPLTEQTLINLPARLRMSFLYGISQSLNGRVMNTCNLSEDFIGYSTRYGDGAGDYGPLSHLTVTEVIQIGKYIGLPDKLVEKVPSDGLCGKTDEENIGFSYKILDQFIRSGEDGIDPEIVTKILAMHTKNKFKLKPMPGFKPNIRSVFSGNF